MLYVTIVLILREKYTNHSEVNNALKCTCLCINNYNLDISYRLL